MFVEQCWFSQKVVGKLLNDYFIVWCWGLCLHCIIPWGLKATKKRVYPVCHIRTRAAECCYFFFTRRLDRWGSPDQGCEGCIRGQGHQHFWHARCFPSQITAHLISLSGRCSTFIWPLASWKLTAGAGASVPWEEPCQTSPGEPGFCSAHWEPQVLTGLLHSLPLNLCSGQGQAHLLHCMRCIHIFILNRVLIGQTVEC